MYVRVSRKKILGTSYEYLQLCEAYRNAKGQPCTRVLTNFGRIDKLDRKKIDSAIDALLKFSSFPSAARFGDARYGRVMDCGDILAVIHLWGRLRLTESILASVQENRAEFDIAKMIQVMVLNRVCDPLSKLGVMRWLQTAYVSDLKADEVQYQHLLRAMDYLIEAKDELEKRIYNELVTLFSPDVDIIFYDLTSCYFEGEGPELAHYGYSRDHRPDRKQLVLALVVTRQGLPIYHEVMPGNTSDVATLEGVARVLSSRFNIRKVVFVCDRGMISRENLEKLEELEFPYIIGLRLRNNQEARSLYQKSLSGFKPDESLNRLMIKEKQKGDYRFIQCHNPAVAEEKKTNREKRLKKVQDRIKSLERLFERKQISADDLYHKVASLLEEQRLSKFFRPKIQSGKIILYMDTEVLREESYLDGKFFLKTNVKAEVIPAAEVVKSYKQLQEVERSFRELKDFLKIRPIFHYDDERVKAHVFICVLAYLFEKLIELQCRRASLRYSGRRALSLLSQFKAIECKVAGQSVTVTNRVDEEIRSIIDAIGFSIPSQAFESTNKV